MLMTVVSRMNFAMVFILAFSVVELKRARNPGYPGFLFFLRKNNYGFYRFIVINFFLLHIYVKKGGWNMTNIINIMENYIYPVLPPVLIAVLRKVPLEVMSQLTEIRLRAERPLLLVLGATDMLLDNKGCPVAEPNKAFYCSREDIHRALQLISKNSLYAYEHELRMGFITIKGGHRIGLAGQAVLDYEQLKTLNNICSMNIRLAREIKGCADTVLPFIVEGNKRVRSTLIISPPRCGKTTMLRDIVRQISTGNIKYNFPGQQVGLVDERSEVAACENGVPTVDLGQRIDVLDGCPKATGMLMLIRSMSPAVVVTDELGRQEDAAAVREALNAGVSVIATVHGRDVAEVKERPFIGQLIIEKYFERYVVLCNKPVIGTIAEIIDAKQNTILFPERSVVKQCG